MFKHLLVPLDGSQLAEASLPLADGIARRCQARVTLLHVMEQSPPPTVHGQRHLGTVEEAQTYLQQAAGRFSPGVEVGCHVHQQAVGDVAEGLAFHAEELAPDLIVLCAHGQVRLRDRLVGNIAQQVIQRQRVPVLLVRQEQRQAVGFPFRNILAPLDDQPAHAQCLDVVAPMARACQARVLLLTVIHTDILNGGKSAAALMPGATQQVLDLAQQQAAATLGHYVQRLEQAGVSSAGRVVRGEVVDQIARAVRGDHIDLVVVGTHGKAGLSAFWERSLMPKLLRRITVPFLLAPV